MPGENLTDEERYRQSCGTGFWQGVFKAEAEYLAEHLQGCQDVLSVGCGPAMVEERLSKCGFKVTGLDVSQEALGCTPDTIRAVVGTAEAMPLPSRVFDAVIFVVSLQFVEDFTQAVGEAARVLKPGGRLVVMLLNPESDFYQSKMNDASSYVKKIKHTQLDEIEKAVAEKFEVVTEYFLGVPGKKLTHSQDPAEAVLYILRGEVR